MPVTVGIAATTHRSRSISSDAPSLSRGNLTLAATKLFDQLLKMPELASGSIMLATSNVESESSIMPFLSSFQYTFELARWPGFRKGRYTPKAATTD